MMKLVVLSCMLAAASAGLLAPLAYTAPLTYTAPFAYRAAYLAPSNYRGPLSLAPGQPANVLAADGRPLDTLDVNLDRSAHYTAKALENGFHLLKKRSVIATPIIAAPIIAAPIIAAPIIAAPIARIATPLITPAVPITYTAPIAAVSRIAPVTYTRTAITHVL